MGKLTSLIKLAENPLAKADDDSMDYENEEESSMGDLNKGRSVSGPRTKLSNAEEVQEIKSSVAELSKAVRALAKSQQTVLAKFGGGFPPMEEEEPMPPMGGGDEFGGGAEFGGGDDFGGGDEFGGGFGEEGEDDLDLGAENMFHSDFDPSYGGNEQAQMRGGDVTMQVRPDQMVRNAIVSKDDSSSNFGEKDSDIAGNRKLDPDNKDKSADEYLIQGGPSAGQGVNKALLKAIAREVVSELSKSKVAKSAEAPHVGNSQIAKGETVDFNALQESAVKLSFKDLNRMRVEAGDLPAGIL